MIKNARITANTVVDRRIEQVVSDTDLKAAPAIVSLYQKGFEESSLNKLLSVGNITMKEHRRLVPTRWSITAVDDTIGKQLIAEIKEFSGENTAPISEAGGGIIIYCFSFLKCGVLNCLKHI